MISEKRPSWQIMTFSLHTYHDLTVFHKSRNTGEFVKCHVLSRWYIYTHRYIIQYYLGIMIILGFLKNVIICQDGIFTQQCTNHNIMLRFVIYHYLYIMPCFVNMYCSIQRIAVCLVCVFMFILSPVGCPFNSLVTCISFNVFSPYSSRMEVPFKWFHLNQLPLDATSMMLNWAHLIRWQKLIFFNPDFSKIEVQKIT